MSLSRLPFLLLACAFTANAQSLSVTNIVPDEKLYPGDFVTFTGTITVSGLAKGQGAYVRLTVYPSQVSGSPDLTPQLGPVQAVSDTKPSVSNWVEFAIPVPYCSVMNIWDCDYTQPAKQVSLVLRAELLLKPTDSAPTVTTTLKRFTVEPLPAMTVSPTSFPLHTLNNLTVTVPGYSNFIDLTIRQTIPGGYRATPNGGCYLYDSDMWSTDRSIGTCGNWTSAGDSFTGQFYTFLWGTPIPAQEAKYLGGWTVLVAGFPPPAQPQTSGGGVLARTTPVVFFVVNALQITPGLMNDSIKFSKLLWEQANSNVTLTPGQVNILPNVKAGDNLLFLASEDFKLTRYAAALVYAVARRQDTKEIVWSSNLGPGQNPDLLCTGAAGGSCLGIPATKNLNFKVPADLGAIELTLAMLPMGASAYSDSQAFVTSPITTLVFKLADDISFESLDPTNSEPLEPGDFPGFSAGVKWQLQTRSNGLLALRVYDHQDNGLGTVQDVFLAGTDFIPVKTGTNTTFFGPPGVLAAPYVFPAFKIEDTVKELRLKAVLMDPLQTTVLKEAVVSYPVGPKVKITLKVRKGLDEWLSVNPARLSDVAYSGYSLNSYLGGDSANPYPQYAVECDPANTDQATEPDRVIVEAVATQNGAAVEAERLAESTGCPAAIKPPDQPVVKEFLNIRFPFNADGMLLRARLIRKSNQISVSDPIADGLAIPIEGIHIVPDKSDDADKVTLTHGFNHDFTYTLSVMNRHPNTCIFRWILNQNGYTGTRRKLSTPLTPNQRSSGPVEFTEPVPLDATLFIVLFTLEDCAQAPDSGATPGESEPSRYTKFQDVLSLPAGPGNAKVPGSVSIAAQNDKNARTITTASILTQRLASGASVSDLFKALAVKPAADDAQAGSPEYISINRVWTFDPPIPPDGSFAATVVFQYGPEHLPDDPNFDESKLSAIAFDQTTAQYDVLPAVIDTQNHTATVQVNSLARAYTLAVAGPFNSTSLLAPVLETTAGSTTGIALLNTGKSAVTLKLSGYAEGGAPLVKDPASVPLAGLEQKYLDPAQTFALQSAEWGWASVNAPSRGVVGYELMARTGKLDGLNLPRSAGMSGILTSIESDAATSTEIHLVNPTPFLANLTLTLVDSSGKTIGTSPVALEPKAKSAQNVKALFPDPVEPFAGYLLLQGDHVFLADEILASDRAIAALAAQSADVDVKTATELYAPHFASGYSATTLLTLVNPTTADAAIVMHAWAEDGTPLGAPVTLTVKAGTQMRKTIAELFTLDPAVVVRGGLTVDSSITGVVGDVSFYDPGVMRAWRASLPLSSQLLSSSLFPYVANGNGLAMSLGLFNPNSAAASARVRVFLANGTLAGEKTVNIAPSNRASGLLEDFVPAAKGQTGGYVTVDSDQQLAAFALLAVSPNGDVAAMPAQDGSVTAIGPAPTPAIDVSPTSLDFGSVIVGKSADRTLTVKNTGDAPLQVKSISAGTPPITVPTPAIPFTVEAGQQTAVTVRFSPTSPGSITPTLVIASDDPNRGTVNVGITATGTTPGSISAPASLDFGSVLTNASITRALSIANTGGGNLTVTALTAAAPFTLVPPPNLPLSIGAGLSVSVTLRFAPTTAGPAGGTLVITSDDTVHGAMQVGLTGAGLAPGSGTAPQISAGGIVNAASYTRVLARGSLASIFGTNLAAATAQT